jgi:hypothetical protein
VVDRGVEDARDFALYTLKVYQDLLKAVSDKDDLETFQTILRQFQRQYSELTAEQPEAELIFLRRRLETAADSDAKSVTVRIAAFERRVEAIRALTLAREQITFVLSARLLDLYLNDKQSEVRGKLFRSIAALLPSTIDRLGVVLGSISAVPGIGSWGWEWWDMPADGEARFIDTHGKPNRMFCVRALQLISNVNSNVVGRVRLPQDDDFIYLLDENNSQGLIATLNEMRTNPSHWEGVLSQRELAGAEALLALLQTAKDEVQRARDDRLIVAALANEKIEKFRQTVVENFRRFARVRFALSAYGAYRDLTQEPAPEEVVGWGFNQLDDKGAFVAGWHVSYDGWGESYGRGLAQSEDQLAFAAMIAGASEHRVTEVSALVATVALEVRARHLSTPVVVQTFVRTLRYEEIGDRDSFIPRYDPHCPKTPLTDVEGYAGVLKIDAQFVPILGINAQGGGVDDKVIIADFGQFVRWVQYAPAISGGNQSDVVDGLYIRVSDLNADDVRREQILASDPQWLREIEDRERYLRMRVLVNVTERFRVEIADPQAAVCISVVD